jgi:hypothetical protein
MIALAMGLLAQIKVLILLGLGVLAVWAIAQTFHRSRAVVPTLGMAVLAGAVLWVANNITTIQDRVGTDLSAPTPATSAPLVAGAPTVAGSGLVGGGEAGGD